MTRGTVLALGSAVASTGVYLVAKWFLTHETPLLDFLLVWFAAGFLYVGGAFAATGNLPMLRRSFRAWPLVLAFGAGHLVSVFLFFGAVRALDPASVAWLSQLDFAIAAALGVAWLKESVHRRDALALALALAGAATLAVSVRAHGAALLMVLGSAVVEGVMAAAAKRVHPRLDIRTLAFHRTWCIVLGVLAARALYALPLVPRLPWESAGGMALGALFGPALGAGLYYMALARTDVHRAATVKTIQPILVLALAWLLWGAAPPAAGVAGGALVTAGVLLVLLRPRENLYVKKT